MPINDYGLLQERIRFEDKQMYAFARKMKETGKLGDPFETPSGSHPLPHHHQRYPEEEMEVESTRRAPESRASSRISAQLKQTVPEGDPAPSPFEADRRSQLSRCSSKQSSSTARRRAQPGARQSRGTTPMEPLPPGGHEVLKLPELTPKSKLKGKESAPSPAQKQAQEQLRQRKIEQLEQAIAEERASRMAFAKNVEELQGLIAELVSSDAS
eukprot:RCo035254